MDKTQVPPFFHNSLEHLSNRYICLLQVGWEKCRPGYQYTNYRNFYLVHFVKSGTGSLFINNQTCRVKPNDVFLIRPNQLAVYTADKENPWEYYYFAFSGAFVGELIERTYFKNNGFLHSMKDTTLCRLIVRAALGMKDCGFPDLYGIEQLFKFLPQIMAPQDTHSSVQSRNSDFSHICISRVREYIQFNYHKPIQISEISKSLNISRSYLYRIFKEQTGSTVEDYLISFRLQQAKKLLRETNISTAMIAQLVGYMNYSSFYRMFKRLEKTTPNKYRALHLKRRICNANGSILEFSLSSSAEK